jgi:hypothetical protein
MSNGNPPRNIALAELSNDQATIVSALSEILGALASIDPEPDSAVVLKFISIALQLATFLYPDPVKSAIVELAQEISIVYKALGAMDAAGQILTRGTILDLAVTPVSTALSDLPNAIADPAHYSASSLIVPCQTVLNDFAARDNEIWNMTYAVAEFEKIYWDDSGQYQSTCYYLTTSGIKPNEDDAVYGLQTPPLNADNVFVFEYKLTLPFYLCAIAAFLAVGRALDPKFLTNRKDDLVQARDTLQWVYDKILTPGDGLTPLLPPDWTASSLPEVACPWPVDGLAPPRPAMRLIYAGVRQHNPPTVGVVIEYGAVEKYSGNSSIGGSYEIDFPAPDESDNPAFFGKLQVRTLKRTKDVYVSCGLLKVWQSINQLNALVGDPPLSSSTFQWPDGSAIDLVRWSFRQVFSLTKMVPSASGYSLRALGKFLIETPPFDTPYSAGATSFSLTTLLTNFND